MRLPFGLTWRGMGENVAASAAIALALWVYSKIKPDDFPSVAELWPYIATFASACVVLSIVRWRQSPVIPIQPHASPGPQFTGGVISPEAVAGLANEPNRTAAVTVRELRIAHAVLAQEVRHFPHLSVLALTLRPDLRESLRGGTLEVQSGTGVMHDFRFIARLDGGKSVIFEGSKASVTVPITDTIPGAPVRVEFLVTRQGGVFEPSLKWFLADASGKELAAGEFTPADFLRQRMAGSTEEPAPESAP